MPAAQRRDPYRNFRFRVEIDGITQAGFAECHIGEIVTECIEYREGNEAAKVRKLPGIRKFSNITLKWGITASMELYQWAAQVVDGAAEGLRRHVVIVLSDEAGNDTARWVGVNAWPVKYSVSDLQAKGNEVCIETLELAHEGLMRDS